MRYPRCAPIAFLCVCVLGGNSACADQLDGLLQKLNDEFRKQYAASRTAALTRSGPVIVVEADQLVLLHGEKRYVGDLLLTEYHRLKMIAHAPVAVYLNLQHQPKRLEPPRKTTREFEDLRDLLSWTYKALDFYGFTGSPKERQMQIVQFSLEFLESKRREPGDLLEFARRMKPLIEANLADAARVQIDAIHAQVSAWRKQLPPDDWQKLRVVIMGSQMPRKGHIAVQYFAKLLKEPGEGKRIIYAEALFDEQKAVNLLGTHLLDTQIGAAFFNDPERMHRDLLADAATEYLKKLKID
jgi:hypothetical protein